MVEGDLKIYKAATMPTTLATTSVGGAISATEITNGTIGEVHFTMASSLSGGGVKTQYSKLFAKNTHATEDLTAAKIYCSNLLDDSPSGNHAIVVRPTSASDDSTMKNRLIGFDASSNPLVEEVACAGDADVTSSGLFSKICAVESRLVSSSALVASVSDRTIKKNGTSLGIIPATFTAATAEISIGLAATLNDTATTTNAATAPGSITFTKPKTYAAGLAVATTILTHGDAQGIWSKWVVDERRSSSPDLEIAVVIHGTI